MKRAALILLIVAMLSIAPRRASAQGGTITDLPGDEHVALCSDVTQWTIQPGLANAWNLNLSTMRYTLTPLDVGISIIINGSSYNAYPSINFFGNDASRIQNDTEVPVTVRLCRQTPFATATLGVPTSTRTPTATPLVPAGCSDVSSVGMTFTPLTSANRTVEWGDTIWAADKTNVYSDGTTRSLDGYAWLRNHNLWTFVVVIYSSSAQIYYQDMGGYAGVFSGVPFTPRDYLRFFSQGDYSMRICAVAPGVATPTVNPTMTRTATATRTATTTPTMTITPTPPLTLPCPVATSIGVPVAPGTASIPLLNGTKFVVTGASSWFNIGTEAREIRVGSYEWNMAAGTYTAYSLTTPSTIWICAGTGQPNPTAWPTEATWTPGPIDVGIDAPACIVVTSPTAPNAYTMPDLSIDLPTLRPLGTPTSTGTIIATPGISTTAIIDLFSTLEAGISTPGASISTAVANYSWQAGSDLSATSSAVMQPALSWLSILNPTSPAWTTDGGPIWALAPAIMPVLPILVIVSLVVFARFLLWIAGWLLKGIDIIIKIIELIPGE